ncbi:MAG: MFS transporter, partial [Coriobacteriales bacterium]|nr:MFS transporter [Coriobacteriales bacterium]
MRIYRKGRRDNVRKEAAQKKSIWSKNLVVVLIGDFLTGMGLSLVVPFLPLYVDTLGVFTKAELNFWSGAIFSITFLVTALVSPFWGRLADRYGRKLMLVRSAAGMAVFMFLTAFATDVYQLLILRALFGVFAGFIPNATALMLANTPKEQSGQILGIINTAPVSGTLIGPLIGGVMVTFLGYAQVFLIIGAIFFVLLLLSMIFVKEDFVPPEKSKTDSIK